jgi:hypothetical protein
LPSSSPRRTALWIGFCAFTVIAAVFLWTEHRAHIGGWLPWLVLLLCPLIHLFMHRGHGRAPPGDRDHGDEEGRP